MPARLVTSDAYVVAPGQDSHLDPEWDEEDMAAKLEHPRSDGRLLTGVESKGVPVENRPDNAPRTRTHSF